MPRLLQRLSESDWEVFTGIAEQLGALDAVEACRQVLGEPEAGEDDRTDVWMQLAGKTVGAFTVRRRVKTGH